MTTAVVIGLVVGLVPILLRVVAEPSERRRVRASYRRAARQVPSAERETFDLVEWMQRDGVPSSYSDPPSAPVAHAVRSWRRGDSVRAMRRGLPRR